METITEETSLTSPSDRDTSKKQGPKGNEPPLNSEELNVAFNSN